MGELREGHDDPIVITRNEARSEMVIDMGGELFFIPDYRCFEFLGLVADYAEKHGLIEFVVIAEDDDDGDA